MCMSMTYPPSLRHALLKLYVDDSKLYLTFLSKDADLAMETICENLRTVAPFSTVLRFGAGFP